MQNVNFQCRHCGNLIAVGADLLGKQVRCPHCQQVITAPPPLPPTPTSPLEEKPPEPTSAAPRQETSDILSEAPANPPPVEMPTEDAWPNLQLEGVASPTQTETEPPSEGLPGLPEAGAFDEPAAAGPSGEGTAGPDEGMANPPQEEWAGAEDAAASELAPPAAASPARRPTAGSGMGPMLLLIFLLPYSIFATGVAIWYYYQGQKVKHPLEYLPDTPADHPGAKREPNKSVSFFRYERTRPDIDLPPRLRVALHQAIQIGDLQVVPEKVEKRQVTLCIRGANFPPEPSLEPALVLTLRLRNTSTDDYFVPTDAAFNNWEQSESGKHKPYTFLEVGPKRFYGGPFVWEMRQDTDPAAIRNRAAMSAGRKMTKGSWRRSRRGPRSSAPTRRMKRSWRRCRTTPALCCGGSGCAADLSRWATARFRPRV